MYHTTPYPLPYTIQQIIHVRCPHHEKDLFDLLFRLTLSTVIDPMEGPLNGQASTCARKTTGARPIGESAYW
jgi:hypothetical protein